WVELHERNQIGIKAGIHEMHLGFVGFVRLNSKMTFKRVPQHLKVIFLPQQKVSEEAPPSETLSFSFSC
uniref:hypothetical protein n=1 Tax=Lacticaseibacillus manihotivorans TaxID=88233 RepID=UPI001FB394D1